MQQRYVPNYLRGQGAPPRVLWESSRSIAAFWSRARQHTRRVQLLHECSGGWRDGRVEGRSANEQGGRSYRLSSGDGSDRRTHGMFRFAVEWRLIQTYSFQNRRREELTSLVAFYELNIPLRYFFGVETLGRTLEQVDQMVSNIKSYMVTI